MPNPRGRPFQQGKPSPNPSGRPLGARNRSTVAAEALLAGDAEALTRKLIERALEGDTTALRICFDRILPPCRERRLNFELPPLACAEDSVKAMAAIAAAVSAGEITLSEAAAVSKLIEGFIRALDVHDIDQRLKFVEAERSLLIGARDHDKLLASSPGEPGEMSIWESESRADVAEDDD